MPAATTRRNAAALGLVLALAAGGCGGSSPSRDRGLTPADASKLTAQLTVAGSAVSRGDRAAAMAALDRFAALVHTRAVAGAFTPRGTRALRTAIAQARRRVAVEVAAPAPVVSPAPVTQAPVAPVTPHPGPRPKHDKPPGHVKHGKTKKEHDG